MCMKNDKNFDDILALPWLTELTRIKVSNKAKDIKKNDSSFERHDQFMAAVQASYLVKFVLDMLDEFDIQLYYDPSRVEPGQQEGEDDLFQYCQVSI